MSDHQDRIGDNRGDGEHERSPSPAQVLDTLVDGAPTDGDLAMLMELRAGLRKHPSGPAKVLDDA